MHRVSDYRHGVYFCRTFANLKSIIVAVVIKIMKYDHAVDGLRDVIFEGSVLSFEGSSSCDSARLIGSAGDITS